MNSLIKSSSRGLSRLHAVSKSIRFTSSSAAAALSQNQDNGGYQGNRWGKAVLSACVLTLFGLGMQGQYKADNCGIVGVVSDDEAGT